MSSQIEHEPNAERCRSAADCSPKRCGYMPNASRSKAPSPAFPSEQSVTATEVMVTVTAMLKAVNLQVFELGMWQAWSGR